MPEKMSRLLLIIEAILIATPLSLLALADTFLLVSDAFEFPALSYVVALSFLALFSLAAIASGWRLFATFLRGGTKELKHRNSAWWFVILTGVLILLSSIISKLLPPSPEYSAWSEFRFQFEAFALSTPILVPLCHLAAERFLRRSPA